MRWLLWAVALCVVMIAPRLVVAESGEGPQSRVATMAIERYEQDLERAATVYEQAVSRAQAKLERALNTAKRLAEQRGDEQEVQGDRGDARR